MDLQNFENFIDRVIFMRGYDYYEYDHVKYVKETKPNVYEAKVIGTDEYTVAVLIDEDLNITETYCDCPYDMGRYCKHQVAVFLTLRDIKTNVSEEEEPDVKSMDPGDYRDGSYMASILSERSKEELIGFIMKLASKNEVIEQRILMEFDDVNNDEDIQNEVSLIQSYIRHYSDRYGNVDYKNINDAVYGARTVLDKAQSAIDEGNAVYSINLVMCVIREMVEFIEYADDSAGIIGDVIDQGFSLIDGVIDNGKWSISNMHIIFENLLNEASHTCYDGWSDWRLKFLDACARISNAPDLRDRLEKYMTKAINIEGIDSWSKNYFAEQVNIIRYNMILRDEGEQKAEEFIEQNLQFTTIRKISIERALQQKNHDLVIKLSLDGEEKDKGLPGRLNEWRSYRYNAYVLAGKLNEQRKLAMDFISDGQFEYYLELKKTYGADAWMTIYPGIISGLKDMQGHYQDIYTLILIEEGEMEKLIEFIKKTPSSIVKFYKHLIPEYKDEVYSLFSMHIEQTASRASNRRAYQGVCDIIRTLIKAGGKEQASQIKQKLYHVYAKRPAFRDELLRVQ